MTTLYVAFAALLFACIIATVIIIASKRPTLNETVAKFCERIEKERMGY